MIISLKVRAKPPLILEVIITGDACCGKSRILERYVYDRFSEKAPATIGVEFIPKNVVMADGTRVRLQLWDTGKPILELRGYSWEREIQGNNYRPLQKRCGRDTSLRYNVRGVVYKSALLAGQLEGQCRRARCHRPHAKQV